MLKKTKLKIIFAIGLACVAGFVFWALNKGPSSRVSFKNIDSAPVETALLHLKSQGVVYVKFVFKNAGVLQNKKEKHGISNIVSEIIFKRINNMSTEETTDKFIELGVRDLFVNSFRDDFEISFYVAKEKAKDVLALMNNAIVQSTFSDGDLEAVKDRIPTVLDPETESPYRLMMQKMLEILYGGCSYGQNPAGSSQAIAGITLKDVNDFIKTTLTRKNLKALFVGDVTDIDALQYLDTLLQNVPEGRKNETVSLASVRSSSKIEHITKSNMHGIVGIAHGIRIDTLSDVEKAALLIIINAIFDDKNSNFSASLNQAGVACKFHVKFLERSFSNALILFAYVNKKDFEKYMSFFDSKIAEYSSGRNLKKFKTCRKYLTKVADNGFYNLSDIDEQMKNTYLPFDKVTALDLSQMMKKIFNKRALRTVICGAVEE